MKNINLPLGANARININEAFEVNEWTRRFGITRDRLMAAVKEVGNNATEVEMFLKKGLRITDINFSRAVYHG